MAAVDTMQLLMEAIQEVVAAHSGVLASVSHTTDSNPDTLTFFCSFGPVRVETIAIATTVAVPSQAAVGWDKKPLSFGVLC